MSDVPRVVRLAQAARIHGATAFDLRSRWSRTGYLLRFRTPDRATAYDLVLDAERLGFDAVVPGRDVAAGRHGSEWQVTVTIPNDDAATLRRAIGGRRGVLP
jgi:hypothetical protein